MTGSDAPPASKRRSFAWIVLGLLVVPAGLGVVLLLQPPSTSPPHPRAPVSLHEMEPDPETDDNPDRSEVRPRKEPFLDAREHPIQHLEENEAESGDETFEENEADEEDWDGRIQRFDENARQFDERIALFEKEKAQGLLDEGSRRRLLWSLAHDLERLSPGTRADVECTESICEVELTGTETVGSLIADLGPFLREHPHGASGIPSDGADPERTFRLVFQKDQMPTSTPTRSP